MGKRFSRLLRGDSRTKEPIDTPEAQNARWILGRFAEMSDAEWSILVAAHASTGRRGPAPRQDLQDRGERLDFSIHEVTFDASTLALRASGDDAAAAWRRSLVSTSKAMAGGPRPPEVSPEEDALYMRAWAYMSAAQWTAGYVVARRTILADEWRGFWRTYCGVLGVPPSEQHAERITCESVLDALRSFRYDDWLRLGGYESKSQITEDATRVQGIYDRAGLAMTKSPIGDTTRRQIEAARETARTLALAAAGPQAAEAHQRIDAITKGRGRSLLVDPADGAAAEPVWQFMDAASNAVLAAGLRPFLTSGEFETLWKPYASTLGESIVDECPPV